jgi:hypothetical protein
MTRGNGRRSRDISRGALRKATEGLDSDASKLAGAVPDLLAEAERRRRDDRRESVGAAVLPVGRRLLPALASAAALLVAASFFISALTAGESELQRVENLILLDEAASPVSDPLLDALLELEDAHG